METVYNLFMFLVALGLIVLVLQLVAGLLWWLIIGTLAAIGAIWSAFTNKK
jgi:hypothetical protein